MNIGRTAWPGPLGGAGGEAGSIHRSGVAAFVAAHALAGEPLLSLELPRERSVPVSLALEADSHVDDLVVTLPEDARCYVQAKVSIPFGSSTEGTFAEDVVRQWVSQFRGGLDPARDRLAVAVGQATQTLMNLRDALGRLRRSGLASSPSYSPRELKALNALRRLLHVQLDQKETEDLLQALLILPLRVSDPGQGDALAAEQMLDGAVVPAGLGGRAFVALDTAMRVLAANRGELDVTGMQLVLSAAGLQVVANERRSEEHQAAAARQAFDRYLEHLRVLGSDFDLRSLGADLSPMKIDSPGSGLLVRDRARGNDAGPIPLDLAIRRRGRCLLLGLPGSGKSTAFRQVAAMAASAPDWPTPLLVRLDRLAERLPIPNPLESVLDVSMEVVPVADRNSVRARLAELLETGDVIVLFDGLDECRDRAPRIVQVIAELLRRAHPDVEIVLSTRETAFASAESLRLPGIELVIPSDFNNTLERLAGHMALENGLEGEAARDWSTKRLSWVRNLLDREAVLAETPLVPVLLLLLVRDGDPSNLPGHRAEVLSQVIDDVVTRAEVVARHGDGLIVGSLTGATARVALDRSFQVIADALGNETPLAAAHCKAALTRLMQNDFALSGGVAEGAAEDALHFWDEAGVFVLEGSGLNRTVRERVRLMREIGEARFAATLAEDGSGAETAWVEAHWSEDESETLRLSAGINARLATSIVRRAIQFEPEMWGLLLATSAVAQGAEADAGTLQDLIEVLRSKIATGGVDSWRATQALLQLPLDKKLWAEVSEEIRSGVPATHAHLGEALAILAWGLNDTTSEEKLVAVIERDRPLSLTASTPEGEPLELRAGPRRRIMMLGTVDPGYSRAFIGSVKRLLPRRPDLAQRVLDAMGQLSSNDVQVVSELLQELGHEDIVAQYNRKLLSSFSNFSQAFARWDQAWNRFLELIAALSEASPVLTRREERRLDALAELIATLRIAESDGSWLETAIESDEGGVARLLQLTSVLGRLDRSVLASEVRLIPDGDRFAARRFLFDFSQPRELDGWEDMSAPEAKMARRDLAAMIGGHPWLRLIAAHALWKSKDHDACVRDLEPVMVNASQPAGRQMAARLIARHDPGNIDRFRAWSGSKDPHVRAVAGAELGRLLVAGEVQSVDIAPTLLDDDRNVRYETAEAILRLELPADTRDLLKRARMRPPVGWQCFHCGQQNEGNEDSCASCHLVDREPSPEAAALLEGI